MTRARFNDVNLDHPWVSQYRLPVVENPWPRSGYLVALVVPPVEEEFSLIGTPEDEDAAIVASYLDFTIARQHYRASYLAELRKQVLDNDNTFNTITILVRKDGTWAYKRSTWTMGPAPLPNAVKSCNSVVELCDFIEANSLRTNGLTDWEKWKIEHGIS